MKAPLLRNGAAFGSGLVFALGLGVAGMTRPSKVIGFLDLFGRWDASLAFVMGGAVLFGLVSFALILRRASPVLVSRFALPARHGLDARLFFGSLLFGAGWGLAGVCPGPALVAVVSGKGPFPAFVAAMAIGLFAADRLFPERGEEEAHAAIAPAATLPLEAPAAAAASNAAPEELVPPAHPPAAAPETACG